MKKQAIITDQCADRFRATADALLSEGVARETIVAALVIVAIEAGHKSRRLEAVLGAAEKAFGNAAYVAFEGARKDRAAFAEEMTASIAHLAAKYHNERAEGGRRFRLLSAIYPAVKLEESASESANLE